MKQPKPLLYNLFQNESRTKFYIFKVKYFRQEKEWLKEKLLEEFERQEQIQRKEEHEEVQRKEEGGEGGGTGGRRKEKEEGGRSVRMVEDEGRSTRMTGEEGRSTRVSSPLRDGSPPCTCAPDLPDPGGTQSGSGRRREKERKRGEVEEGRSRSKGRKEEKDKDWQELLEQSYLLPAPGSNYICPNLTFFAGSKERRGQLTSVSSMGEDERQEWRGGAAEQDKQEPREVGADARTILFLIRVIYIISR